MNNISLIIIYNPLQLFFFFCLFIFLIEINSDFFKLFKIKKIKKKKKNKKKIKDI